MGKVADGLGCSIDEAAVAVIRLVDANMINALKLVSIQRGHDPRDFALMVGGGGGGMHGASLGRELGVKEIAVPRFPGLFSAWGMLATAPRRDFMLTALQRAEALEIADVRALFAELREEAERYFHSEGGHDTFASACHIDMRYAGQEHAVTVPIDLDRTTRDTLLDAFHAAHERAYTFRLADTPVELVTFRLTATADVARPELTPWTAEGRSAEAAARGITRGRFRRGRPARDPCLRPRSAAAGIRGGRSGHRRGAVIDDAGLPRPARPRGRSGFPQNHRGMNRQ